MTVARNSSSLILLQVLSRGISFILNLLLVRLTNAAVLGLSHVKLDFFHRSVVGLSRDALRFTLLRLHPIPIDDSSLTDKNSTELLLQRSYASLFLALPLTLVFLTIYALSCPQEILDLNLRGAYLTSVIIYILAIAVELAAEPYYQLMLQRGDMMVRVRVEAIASTIKAATIISVVFLMPSPIPRQQFTSGMYAFALGQLVNSLVTMTMLHRLFATTKNNSITLASLLRDSDFTSLWKSMEMQVIVKYFLDQGDWWIVSLVVPLREQGIYTLVSNYCSLPHRLVLQPLEEAALLHFSSDQVTLSEKGQHLELLLKLNIIILGYAIVFVHDLLRLVMPLAWFNTAGTLMAVYLIFIPVIAISGCLEVFVTGCGNGGMLQRLRMASLVISPFYYLIAFALTIRFGVVGLVVAGIFNHSARAIVSIPMTSINHRCLPSYQNWLILIMSAFINRMMMPSTLAILATFALSTGCLFIFEGEVIRRIANLIFFRH